MPRLPYYDGPTVVEPSAEAQTLATAGKSMAGDITVNAISASADPSIQAGNIREGAVILGVAGTYAPRQVFAGPYVLGESWASIASNRFNPKVLQVAGRILAGPITLSRADATWNPSIKAENIAAGETALGIAGTGAIGAPYPRYDGEPATPSATEDQVIRTAGKADGYLEGNVAKFVPIANPITKEIDPNIKPENIKEGVYILNVCGTYK